LTPVSYYEFTNPPQFPIIFYKSQDRYSICLTYGLESGVAATIAHFIAFGIFNGIAIFQKALLITLVAEIPLEYFSPLQRYYV
jgi:hypothetical protein